MSAGKKKYDIEIHQLVKENSSTGSIKETYQFKTKLRAEVKFNSNSLGLNAYEIIQSDRIIFRVYRRNIQYTDRIIFNEIEYGIVSINNLDYANEMEIIAEKINQ